MKKDEPQIILGLDPGYALTGWGVLKKEGQKLALIEAGCFTSDKSLPHPERLWQLSQKINALIKKYQPNLLAIEELFFFKNLKTALKVAEARGVILAAAHSQKIPIQEFTPLQIKQALVGYGRADKNQIQQMVKVVLNLKKIITPDDAADAVAVAITCAHQIKNK
ncbi:MAG TPA: crossover junction endodeoxyribonuclease RuvC [bacterium]|nr:crossover junction endodeoxyribonuclease RuvC [bacterium]HPL95417.1 crossover junction endodeoxyribonuclease RuvC [bacterium]